MSRRAESVPDLPHICCEFENKNLKAKERMFGWPVSDAIAEILKRIRVTTDLSNEEENSRGAEGQSKDRCG